MSELVLIFDIPKGERHVELKVWRELKKINAKMIQHSVWRHSDLSKLIKIATFIKKSGGSAAILEEKLIF